MPQRARAIEGGLAYHVLNRANARRPLFTRVADYAAFERVLEEAFEREPLRILGYCLMPNHWHLVVWPNAGADSQVSEFMRWLYGYSHAALARPSAHVRHRASLSGTIQIVPDSRR